MEKLASQGKGLRNAQGELTGVEKAVLNVKYTGQKISVWTII